MFNVEDHNVILKGRIVIAYLRYTKEEVRDIAQERMVQLQAFKAMSRLRRDTGVLKQGEELG